MKITAIKIYQVDLPLREGRYNWSGGNFMEVFDSTVVAVETDAGITGYAECCPLGSAYLHTVGDEDRERANRSNVHIDFMIGSDEVDVTGTTREGDEVPLLRGGDWQL